mgnify:CR=1 FL=1
MMARFTQGKSGNPNGRPKGSSLQAKLAKTVGDDFDSIIGTMVLLAKSGDVSAANVLLSRLVPALRPVSQPINIDIPKDVTPSELSELTLKATLTGQLSPETAISLISAIRSHAELTDLKELQEKVEALENRRSL